MRRAIAVTIATIVTIVVAAFTILVHVESASGHHIGARNAEEALKDHNYGGWCGRGWNWWCSGPEEADCDERVKDHSYFCDVSYFESRASGPFSITAYCVGRVQIVHDNFKLWLQTGRPSGDKECAR